MKDLLMIGLFLFFWIALNRWVLPAMGIQTCMSGACCGDSCQIPTEPAIVPVSDEEAERVVESSGEALQEAVADHK